MVGRKQEKVSLISIQTPERQFEGILHFAVYDNDLHLIAASYMGYETTVRAISAGIIEKRNVAINQTQLKLLPGQAYKKRERPIGMGDVYHGFIFPRQSSWNDIKDDEDDGIVVHPIVFAPEGNIKIVVGRFLTKKFNLPDCWSDTYYDLLEEDDYEYLQVKVNPDFPLWKDLQVIRLLVTEKRMLEKIEYALKNKQLVIPKVDNEVQGVFDEGWSLKEFIKNNAVQLANKLSEVRPYFDPEQDQLHWGFRLMKRTPFPAQAYKIQGLVNSILSKDVDARTEKYDIGDMGTGKSISLCGILLMYHLIKQERGRKFGTSCLLSAPSITIPKWKEKEILPTIPHFAKIEIIESTEDAIRVLNKIRRGHKPAKNNIEIYMIGLDRAKLGHEPYFSGIWKRVRGEKEYAWHCPDCGAIIKIEEENGVEIPADFYHFVQVGIYPTLEQIRSAYQKGSLIRNFLKGNKIVQDGLIMPNGIPHGFVKKWKYQGTPRKCQSCTSPLWRPALKSRHETRSRPRYNCSKILKKTKKYFDFFAQDEVQQTKSEDSGRGDAYAQMVKAAKHVINLTGTLTTGKSTSIKEIIWRANPRSLLEEGFDHNTGMVAWARRYGVLKEIFEIEEEDRGIVTRRKRRALQPKEEPGIAPALLCNHLLHKAAFTELRDLGLPLVRLHEIPEIIPMDPEHRYRYRAFHDKLHEECKKTGKWGKFIPATINYGDRPDLGASVTFINKETGEEYVIDAPPLFEKHAKLRRLIEIVQQELAEDRGVVIFNRFTDGYGLNEYIQQHLHEAGIKSEILSANTTTLQRFEWLQKKADAGVKVIITNLSLVEVGLDLMPWPTIIYYQLDYDINKVRQSSRRAWRIGQTRECRTYYLVYDDSQQLEQFKVIMAKRGHAMLVEGRLDSSELAQYALDSNTAMATEIAESLNGTKVADLWTKLAAKDIDEGLELVDEKEFKQVLKERMEELAKLTLSKCMPIPDKLRDDRLVEQFRKWMSYFATPWKEKLESNITAILTGIRNNSIPGFVFNEDTFYFDEISQFGFAFVDEIAIVDHILRSIGQPITNNTHDQRDISTRIKMIEIKGSQKTRGRNKPIEGQLAFDLFS